MEYGGPSKGHGGCSKANLELICKYNLVLAYGGVREKGLVVDIRQV